MSDDDPFEAFDPVDDREGDPFEAFERPDDDADEDGDGEADATATGDPFADLGPGDDASVEQTAPDVDDPFSDMAGREGDPFGDESVFERVDVGTIDADSVWAQITGDADLSDAASGSRYAEVSKHRYCEQCEHFSAPPDVHCSNEGTEILEFTDMEQVRLLDCPVVAEQRELADQE
ncbi:MULTISPECIES: hypothetical protein [Haloarcula]|uniref:hypothetical protein n=1 Tax=Haloarcula TaxID=2237 RepID=UPI0023EAAB09|nr:hypothetical protein [Halomicroarcula sp. XH51]